MRDFSLDIYEILLKTAIKKGYTCTPYVDFIEKRPEGKTIILRHDVDDLPENSLATAQLEKRLGIKGTYYFRCVKQSFNLEVLREIKNLGHEIGYHYEDLALCGGNYERAYEHFLRELQRFRSHAEIKTICMHGSPLSKYDNRALWKKYNYKELGILAEPYFDTDFSKVFYLSDTGRKWNNAAASIRDRVESSISIQVRSTEHLIQLLEKDELPQQIMINIHPQRWTNSSLLWWKELIWQNIKNAVKRFVR